MKSKETLKQYVPKKMKINKSFGKHLLMETKVKELTTEQLRKLISDIVKETMEDFIEDAVALSSDKYLNSIETARKDYKEGRVKYLEEVFDV